MSEFAGHLLLQAAANTSGRTAIGVQAFRAPYHLSKPYWDPDSGVLMAQIVNPTAGILSGDRLESDIAVMSGASLLVTTPSASRVFKMNSGSAHCRQRFRVASGGWLEVLPEPLVPHRGSSYRQQTYIEVEPGGELFFADLLMAGRVAHGEAWLWKSLCLEIDVRLGGELILRERFAHRAQDLQALAAAMGSGAGACFGNAVLIAADSDADETWRKELISLHADGLWVGVSPLRKGGWSIKFVAENSIGLRQGLRAIRKILSSRWPRLACNLRKL